MAFGPEDSGGDMPGVFGLLAHGRVDGEEEGKSECQTDVGLRKLFDLCVLPTGRVYSYDITRLLFSSDYCAHRLFNQRA